MSPANAPNAFSDAAGQAAAQWDARLRMPECTEADRRRFRDWRDASPDNAAAFEALQAGLSTLKAHAGRPELSAMRDAARALRREGRARRAKTQALRLAVAACAVVALGLSSFAVWQFDLDRAVEPDPAVLASLDQPPFYATEVGEREVVTLDDGSVVTLNTASQIRVAYTADERAITLVRGQAHFDVAHGDERAFAVYAGDRRLVALGTAFDVRLDGDEVSVTLVEGRLAVEQSTPIPGDVSDPEMVALERAELEAGQRLIASAREARPEIELADLEAATLWREGRVIFEDARLADAVAELNRYVADPIVLNDPELAELRINGLFRTGETRVFLGALRAYYPVETRTRRDGAIVLSWAPQDGGE